MSEPVLLQKLMPVVGMRDLVYATIEKDDTEGYVPGPVKAVQGVMGFSWAPNSKNVKSYGDDGTFASYSAGGEAEGEVEVNTIPKEMEQDWFGHKLDKNGAVVTHKDDICQPIALGFRSMKTDGTFRYMWYYKVEPSTPEESYRTTEDGATIQTRKIKISGKPRDFDGKLRVFYDSSDKTVPATVLANWLKAVYEGEQATEPEPTPEG